MFLSRMNLEAQLKNSFSITLLCLLVVLRSVSIILRDISGWTDVVGTRFSLFVCYSDSAVFFLSKQTDLFPGVFGLRIRTVCPGCSVHSCLSAIWQDWQREHLIWYVHGCQCQHAGVGLQLIVSSVSRWISFHFAQHWVFGSGLIERRFTVSHKLILCGLSSTRKVPPSSIVKDTSKSLQLQHKPISMDKEH